MLINAYLPTFVLLKKLDIMEIKKRHLCISAWINVVLIVFCVYLISSGTFIRDFKRFIYGNEPIKYEDAKALEGWDATISQLNQPFDVCFYGHSICAFGNWQDAFEELSIINLGYPSQDLDGLLRRSNQVELSKAKSVVLIMGTNSLSYTNERFENTYQMIVNKIKCASPGIKIYALNIPPRNNGRHQIEMHNHISSKNEIIKRICQRNDLTYIDVYSSLTQDMSTYSPGYTDDGVHPSSDGYNIIYSILRNYL